MHLHSFCLMLTRLPIYISLALNYFQNQILFLNNAWIIEKGEIFRQNSCRGVIAQTRLKTTGLDVTRHIITKKWPTFLIQLFIRTGAKSDHKQGPDKRGGGGGEMPRGDTFGEKKE